jgi:ATP-dependent DNA helicase RecG
MTKEDLLRMIAEGESQRLELKSSFNVEAIEAVAAFANAEGGKVVIGVNNKSKIVGVDINSESVQNWVNEIKSKTEPAIVVDANQFELNGKTVVILSVSEHPIKPIAIQGRYFKRVQNSNHQLSAMEIANLSLHSLQLSWDSYPDYGKTLEDLDTNAVERFIGKVNAGGRLNLNGLTWADNLRKLKLIDGIQPTNAAYLLFGKDNIGYNVHMGRFKTPSMIIDDKMLNCNLFEAVEETMKYLLSQIKVAYEITGKTTQRTEIFEYPLPVLRELVLNTIIHRDYTSSMDVQIKVFDNKIIFFSPGELYGKQTVEALQTDDYVAYTRNKLIAEAFYLTGDIEKYGTGYTRIRKEIADYPTMKFEFEEKPSAWLVTISYEKRKTKEISNLDNAGTLELATKVVSGFTLKIDQVKTLIISLKENVLSIDELQLATELATKVATSSRQNFRKTYLLPAIKEGFVAMLYPDRPHHPKQKYYLTDNGKELLKTLEAQS